MATGKIQRNTQQRQVILEELRKLKSHPTAADLYQVVRKRLPRISLGTVYRNLETMARNDIIKKLDTGGSKARFDGDVVKHNHVRCIECGRVDDIFDIPTEFTDEKFEHKSGYEVLGCRLEFVGICPQCRENKEKAHNQVKH